LKGDPVSLEEFYAGRLGTTLTATDRVSTLSSTAGIELPRHTLRNTTTYKHFLPCPP
jgi:hypothetical protein